MANGPAFDYGNLLTGQARGNYRMQSMGAQAAEAALGNTQNWAGLAAATSAASAQRDVATINAAADTAQQGIANYGSLAGSIVNAYGGIAQQGISSAGDVRRAELAIEQEKVRRGNPMVGAIAGTVTGLAGLALTKDDGYETPPMPQLRYGNSDRIRTPRVTDASRFTGG